MPAPSALAIATSAVQRLLKEEASYRSELAAQQAQVRALADELRGGPASEDGNAEFMLRQQKTAVEQTRAVFEPLRTRVRDAVVRLEDQILEHEATGAAAEVEQAKSVLAQAKAAPPALPAS